MLLMIKIWTVSQTSFLSTSESCVDYPLPLVDINISPSRCTQMAVELDKSTSTLIKRFPGKSMIEEWWNWVPRAGLRLWGTLPQGQEKKREQVSKETQHQGNPSVKKLLKMWRHLEDAAKDKEERQPKSSAAGSKKSSQHANRDEGPIDIGKSLQWSFHTG